MCQRRFWHAAGFMAMAYTYVMHMGSGGRRWEKRQKDELPDYTVANMDVDGMPWNTGRKKFSVQDQELDTEEKEPLTKAETKAVIWLSLKAGLVIGGVFIGAAALFLLFCVYVWLR